MEKLVVIDGNSILNRAFYGIMSSKMLQTADGTYTNAVYGFLAIMFKLIEDVNPEIWKGAMEGAKKVIEKYGEENLGPYSDFEWGMINGKLSALRWVLGCEWDMLDT